MPAFAGLLVAMFIAALDQTIIATALPTIAGRLGGLSDLPWVVTVYVLAAAASTPLWGQASDLYGRRGLLRAAIALFIACSALAGAAQSIGWLIAARALQGLGAGGVMTLAMACVGDLVPPRERGRYQGYIQLTFLLASLAGPLLGGLFVDRLSWRAALYVNVPIGLVALGLLSRLAPAPRERRPARLDYPGALLLAGAVVAVLLIATWGGERYAWGSAEIIGLGAAALALGAALVWRERRASEPVLPLAMLADPVVAVVSAALFVATVSLFAALVFLPVFLQLVSGASATGSGLLMLPLLAAGSATTIASGRILARTGRYKVFPLVGLALMSLGLLLFSSLGADGSRVRTALFEVVFGAGFGMVTQILVVAIQNAVSQRQIGTATAAANLFRALGGAVGVAVYGAILAAGLRHRLPADLPHRGVPGVTVTTIQATPGAVHALPAAVRDGIAHAVAGSLHEVFLVAAPVALAGLLIVTMLRERPLRRTHAHQPKEETPMPIITAAERGEANVVGADHGATVSLILDHSNPGEGPKLHRHPYDETWVVIEGDLTFVAGEERHHASPGDVVIVPPNAPHKFTANGPGRAHLVCIHAAPRLSTEWLE